MSKLRIMLADDHGTVREGLKLLLDAQADMEVVGEAGDGREAVRLAKELLPDIVVMDITMPQLNGLKAAEMLNQCCPQIKILTLSRHTDDGYLQQLLRAGASGYVLKQSAAAELIRAVREVAAGRHYLDPSITGKVIGRFAGRQTDEVSAAALRRGRDLTEREKEVLRLIAWGYSNKEIAARLDLSVKTIEAHKANAMTKLNIHSRIEIVRYALLKNWLQET